jgi:hypothetical protein
MKSQQKIEEFIAIIKVEEAANDHICTVQGNDYATEALLVALNWVLADD